MLAAYASDLYNIVLVLHILCAIVGFGSVLLNGIYASQARTRKGVEGLAITEANHFVSGIGQFFIYGVFVFGVLLVLIGDNLWDFGQTWVWLSMALFIVALGISHGLLKPRVEKIIGIQREMLAGPPPAGGPPPQLAVLEATGKQVAMCGMTLTVMMIVILSFMVFKPGI